MVRGRGLLLLCLSVAAGAAAPAQVPPQVGRVPLLADLPAQGGACSTADPMDDLRRAGVVRVVMFQGGDPQRLIGVGVDVRSRPRSLLILSRAPASERRGEGESLQASLDANGVVTGGWRRSFTSGSMSRRSDDKNLGLLAGDSAQIPVLARAVMARCAR